MLGTERQSSVKLNLLPTMERPVPGGAGPWPGVKAQLLERASLRPTLASPVVAAWPLGSFLNVLFGASEGRLSFLQEMQAGGEERKDEGDRPAGPLSGRAGSVGTLGTKLSLREARRGTGGLVGMLLSSGVGWG